MAEQAPVTTIKVEQVTKEESKEATTSTASNPNDQDRANLQMATRSLTEGVTTILNALEGYKARRFFAEEGILKRDPDVMDVCKEMLFRRNYERVVPLLLDGWRAGSKIRETDTEAGNLLLRDPLLVL